jgi:hypothetical protein
MDTENSISILSEAGLGHKVTMALLTRPASLTPTLMWFFNQGLSSIKESWRVS